MRLLLTLLLGLALRPHAVMAASRQAIVPVAGAPALGAAAAAPQRTILPGASPALPALPLRAASASGIAPAGAATSAATAASPAQAAQAAAGPASADAASRMPAEEQSGQAAAVFEGLQAKTGPLRLLITGAPGSGKGEASKRLARDYGVVHISAGELLRKYAENDPATHATMKRGELVAPELVVRLVSERLAQPDVAERGYVLDGFPRRVVEAAQFEALLAAGGVSLDAVIVLEVDEKELLRRILARGRFDDTPEVFRDRIKIYKDDTLPAVERLKTRAPVLKPDVGRRDADGSYAAIKGLLDRFLAGLRGEGTR